MVVVILAAADDAIYAAKLATLGVYGMLGHCACDGVGPPKQTFASEHLPLTQHKDGHCDESHDLLQEPDCCIFTGCWFVPPAWGGAARPPMFGHCSADGDGLPKHSSGAEHRPFTQHREAH